MFAEFTNDDLPGIEPQSAVRWQTAPLPCQSLCRAGTPLAKRPGEQVTYIVWSQFSTATWQKKDKCTAVTLN